MAAAPRTLLEWEEYFIANGMLNFPVHVHFVHQNRQGQVVDTVIGWPDEVIYNGMYERTVAYNILQNMAIIEEQLYD